MNSRRIAEHWTVGPRCTKKQGGFGMASSKGASSREGSTRGKNFNGDELRLLARSYLSVSQSSTVGNQQKGGTFWEKIMAEYHKNKAASMEDRTMKSLESKYGDMRKDCHKFNGCYEQVVQMHTSGVSKDELWEKALDLFKTKNNDNKKLKGKARKFQYACPYEIMLKDPKLGAKAEAGGKLYTRKRSLDVDVDAIGDENVMKQGSESTTTTKTSDAGGVSKVNFLVRPMGNMAAKAKERFEKMDASAQQIAADAHRKMAEAVVERLKVMESQHMLMLLTMLMPSNADEETPQLLKVMRDEEIARLRKRILSSRKSVEVPDGKCTSSESPPSTNNVSSSTIQSSSPMEAAVAGADDPNFNSSPLINVAESPRTDLLNINDSNLQYESVAAEFEVQFL